MARWDSLPCTCSRALMTTTPHGVNYAVMALIWRETARRLELLDPPVDGQHLREGKAQHGAGRPLAARTMRVFALRPHDPCARRVYRPAALSGTSSGPRLRWDLARVHPAGAVVRREGFDVVLPPTRRQHREETET